MAPEGKSAHHNINQIAERKYIGDVLRNISTDFSRSEGKEPGHVPQYYVENSHEAHLPREIFMQFRGIIRRRIVHPPDGKTEHSAYAQLSNMICGGCLYYIM